MYSAPTNVYNRGGPSEVQSMVQAGSQDGMPHAYFPQTGVSQPMLSVYGGAPIQLSPQHMTPYAAAAPYGYGGVLTAPNATSPPPQQGAYYAAPHGAQTFMLHNSAVAPHPGMFMAGANTGYLPVSYPPNAGMRGPAGMVALCPSAPQSPGMPNTHSPADGFANRQPSRGFGGSGGTWAGHHGNVNAAAGASSYEVHDTHLKTPIPVSRDVVVPTSGSERLFHSRGKDNEAQRSRTMLRVCEPFVEGTCTSGERCGDVHVYPEHVQAMRQQLSSWLTDREREFNTIRSTTPDKTFRVFVADLKEVVEIPAASLSFTKGLYVDPATRARRTRGATPQGRGNVATAQVPTGCGLYSTDPANCKWGRWCNQVHISKAWMNTRKQEFDQWFTKLEDHYVEMASEHVFVVHDPQSKSNLEVPKYAISGFTRGLFQGSERKAPSVCLLFQRGRCTAAACCNQIHVDHAYLDLSRRRAAYCHEHSTDGQPTPSPALTEMDQQLRALRELLQVKEAEEVRRLTAEAARRQRDAAATASLSPATVATAAKDNARTEPGTSYGQRVNAVDSPTQPGLIEHIAVDDDEDTAPLQLEQPAERGVRNMGGVAIRHADGSYTNNPYGSITSLAEDPSASSSVLSLGGLVIAPGRGSAGAGSGGGVGGSAMAVTVQQRSGSSFSRTPAASMTGLGSGAGKRAPYTTTRAAHNYFDPQTDGSSLFFNASSNSYSNPSAGAGNSVPNHGANQAGYFTNGDGYYPGSSVQPQSTEDGSLHFSVTQFVGVNASTVSIPKTGVIAQPAEDNDESIH